MSIEKRGIERGWEVYTADNEHVGEVSEDHADYLHVHRGRLFGRDEYYFPANVVGRTADRAVSLTLSRAALEGRDWATRPAAAPGREDRLMSAAATTGTAPHATTAAGQRVETLDRREVVVPVVEERLDVAKRPVELGEVAIGREVVERRETVPVEVMHEEVRVERRSAAREATPEDLRAAGGQGLAYLDAGQSVVIPPIEEVVEVRKRLMVREELVITKQKVTERHAVTETLRRVEPQVESAGRLEREVDATAGAAGRAAAGTPGGRIGDDRNPLERARDAAGDARDR